MPMIQHAESALELPNRSEQATILSAYKDVVNAAPTVVHLSTEPPTTLDPSLVENSVPMPTDYRLMDDTNIVKQGYVSDSPRDTTIKRPLVRPACNNDDINDEKPSRTHGNADPTATGLPDQLLNIGRATPEVKADGESSLKLQEMEGLIANLSAHFPKHVPRVTNFHMSGEVVLLTGSTGALGSQLLAYLASSPGVSRIYALNRRSKDDKPLWKRQSEAFVQRELNTGIINSPKVVLVEGDITSNDFDINPELFSEIRDNITLIIHNAWKVNFLSKLASFQSNIRSVRTLVDLALGSPRQNPPRIIYTSSVSVYKNWIAEQGRPLEAPICDPKVVLGTGYSESKYVGECILENAAKSTALRPVIVRIGQLTSNSSGAWNSTDWVPSIVIAGKVLGALPSRDDCVAWLSLDIAAEAIFEFRNSESQYLHLSHPNPTSWSSLFEVFSKRLNVPLICWNEWRARVERFYGKDGSAVRVLNAFKECCDSAHSENREAPGLPLMDMQQALKASSFLSRPMFPQTRPEDAERWLQYWRRTGTLS